MKKYEMIFDPENKLIGFYNDYKGKSFNISFTILIIFIIIIIGLIVIVNHIMKLKRRKTRANEIDEVYDYVPANQERLGIKDI
jgi:flagellar biosynthesis/type III secretory pathway M-ring protein FliF/YscJ